MARLVDYEPARRWRPRCCCNSTWPTAPRRSPTAWPSQPPARRHADPVRDRAARPAGRSTRDRPASVPPTPVQLAWNRGAILPYWFDDSERCLPAGATQMYVLGSGLRIRQPGQPLLIETAGRQTARRPAGPPDRARCSTPGNCCDPLYPPPPNRRRRRRADLPARRAQGTAVTRISWGAQDALTADRDLTVHNPGRQPGRRHPGPDAAGREFLYSPSRRAAADRHAPGDRPHRAQRHAGRPVAPVPLHAAFRAPDLAPQPTDPTPTAAAGDRADGPGPPAARRCQWDVPAMAARCRAVRPGLHRGRRPLFRHRRRPPATRSDTTTMATRATPSGSATASSGPCPSRARPSPRPTGRAGGPPATSRPTRSRPSIRPIAAAAGVISVTNPLPATGGADPEPLRVGPAPGTPGVPGRPVPGRPAGGLRGRGRDPPLGRAGRHGLPMDRKLAHRLHDPRPRCQ